MQQKKGDRLGLGKLMQHAVDGVLKTNVHACSAIQNVDIDECPINN